MGRLHHANCRPQLALSHHKRALQLATDLGYPTDQAPAHDGLAYAHRALQQRDRARLHWQQALHILTSLGIDQSEEVEANVQGIHAKLNDLNNQHTWPPR